MLFSSIAVPEIFYLIRIALCIESLTPYISIRTVQNGKKIENPQTWPECLSSGTTQLLREWHQMTIKARYYFCFALSNFFVQCCISSPKCFVYNSVSLAYMFRTPRIVPTGLLLVYLLPIQLFLVTPQLRN